MFQELEMEYEEKRGRIAIEIELLILDVILSALEKLNLHEDEREVKKPLESDEMPF